MLLLERAAVHGGTSSLSGGHFYLGGGTAVQRATGHEDSVEEMVKYLTATSKEPEPDKIRAYCEGSVEHFDWLESLGFEFERSFYPEKAVILSATRFWGRLRPLLFVLEQRRIDRWLQLGHRKDELVEPRQRLRISFRLGLTTAGRRCVVPATPPA